MAKVLLIDDEIHVRSLMKYLIHWEELGLTLAGEYDNAEDALAQMQQDPADIVITDICMPGMDGLEMIAQMQQSNSDCSFVLISGYRDFEYAKKAIGLGVSEYIVKPINEEEINRVLRKVITGAVKNRQGDTRTGELRQKLYPTLIRKGKRVEPDVGETYGFHFALDGQYRILQLGFCNCSEEDNTREIIEEFYHTLREDVGAYCYETEGFSLSELRYDILLQYEKERDGQILRCIDMVYRNMVQRHKADLPYRFYLSVGQAVGTITDICQSIDSAHFFMSGRLGYGNTRVYIADILPKFARIMEENQPIPRETVREFERFIETMNAEGIRSVIRKLFKGLQERKEQNYIFYFYLIRDLNSIMMSVFQRLQIHPSDMNRMEQELEEEMDNCDSVTMLQIMTERYCIDQVNRCLDGKQDNAQVYVNLAKKYIDEHYAEEISLQTIADLAHVNAAYLSSVFKKTTGINYLTYLTEVRMEKAKELLCQLDMNLSQIANAVGYTSTRYFSKTFENEVGMKPSEYRRVYLREQR